MLYNVDRIKQDVRVCLDENRLDDMLIAVEDIDTLKLDEIIESKVLEAVEKVHKEAPYYMLHEGHNFGDAVYWGDLESGWVLLPEDFMRLVIFEMDDWEQPVYTAMSVTDPQYQKCRSRIKAIRGTAQRPVCVITTRPEGKVLEFYSCKSTEAEVRRGVYIPYPVDEDGWVDISERCYGAVVYTIAGLTLESCGEHEKAERMLAIAQSKVK